MAARGKGAPPAAPTPGLLLDDRYELEQVRGEQHLPSSVRSILWRAVDHALDRHVAVRTVTGLDPEDRARLLDAAVRASQVADSRFVRVLDVGAVGADDEIVWIATEWVDVPTLTAVVRDEPLRPAVATELARQCAEALLVAARGGLHHGRLHPDQVLLPTGAVPRITDLATAAVVHGDGPGDEAGDVQGVGALLFAAVTSRWPRGGWRGLPAADPRAATQGRPRLVRAGISRDLDDVTHRAVTGGTRDLHALVRSLSALPTEALDAPPPTPRLDQSSTLRRWLWRIVPPVAVLAIGVTGWAIGSDLGRVPPSARQAEARLPPTQSGDGGDRARLVWKQPPQTSGFDPAGDGEENDDEAALAVDRDGSTAWHTSLYRDDSHLGGLKPGVGLLLDLGRARRVRIADLELTAPGATLEIRAGNRAPQQAADLSLVTTRSNAGRSPRLTLDPAVKARYWLVWFTNLPPDSGGFRAGVAEVVLLG